MDEYYYRTGIPLARPPRRQAPGKDQARGADENVLQGDFIGLLVMSFAERATDAGFRGGFIAPGRPSERHADSLLQDFLAGPSFVALPPAACESDRKH